MTTTPLTQRPLHHKFSALSFIGFIIIGGFILWSAFMKPTQDIKVEEGGTLNIDNAPKRFAIPFVEGGVEQTRGSSMGTFIRAGLRIEF